METTLGMELRFAVRSCCTCGCELDTTLYLHQCHSCNINASAYRRACKNFMRWGVLLLWRRSGNRVVNYQPKLLTAMLRYRGCMVSTRTIWEAVVAYQERWGLPVISTDWVPADSWNVRDSIRRGVGQIAWEPWPRRSAKGGRFRGC
jgi:hypothetical protein